MGQEIKLGDKSYKLEDLTEGGKLNLKYFQFTNQKLEELKQMLLLLQQTKRNCIENLKKEVLTEKAGFLFDEN